MRFVFKIYWSGVLFWVQVMPVSENKSEVKLANANVSCRFCLRGSNGDLWLLFPF